MMRDKDHRGFFDPLKDLVDEVVLTQADLAAVCHRPAITDRPQRYAVAPLFEGTPRMMRWGKRGSWRRQEDLICVTGSLMLVGDVKALLGGCGLSPLRG